MIVIYKIVIVKSRGKDLSVTSQKRISILLHWKYIISLLCEVRVIFIFHTCAQLDNKVSNCPHLYFFVVWLGDEHTTGYVGKSVVLKSGADQSWILTRVQWSIYHNTTYIASLQNGETLTERFWIHKGRLKLNNKTGDLTIKNLSMDDTMTYTVNMVTSNNRKESKIHLKVQERLKKPNIHQVFNSFKDGHCHIFLRCDLSDENVQLSWTLWDGLNGSYISANTNLTESFLWTSFSVKYATFRCTASTGQQSETQQIKVGCKEETKLAKACSSCSCALMVFLGIICTAVVFGLLYVCKGKLKATCANGPLHVYQSLFKC
ncbi:putative SLAM family member 5-like [Triplophysa rosa]|uniref:SLAM family member 5-like n=1 Tax=Triplophysa rosa TaxID=992332 RepID=A0A9W7X3C9_TRIRA|nr:putative SLAM family member 5-like [Triplophysa rosa]